MNDTKDIIGEMKEAIGEKIVSLAKSKEHLLAKNKEGLPIVLLTYREVMINTHDLTSSLPSGIWTLFQEFDNIFPSHITKGLPRLRGLEHQIDFVPGSQLQNRSIYRCNPYESRELQRKVEELLKKGFVSQSMSQFSVHVFLVCKRMELGGYVWIVVQSTK